MNAAGSGRHDAQASSATIPGTPVPADHDLPEWDRSLARQVATTDASGITHHWNLLDNGPALAAAGVPVRGTVLCVHGNPTWSYLWRRVVNAAPPGWRVIAPDQLGMGYSSEPTGRGGWLTR